MVKLFTTPILLICFLSFGLSVKAASVKFYTNALEHKVFCQSSVSFHGYYYIEYNKDNTIKLFERVGFKNDSLFFNNKNESVSFDKFINDNKLVEVEEVFSFDKSLFSCYSKTTSQFYGVHQMTGDSVLLFNGVFNVRYKLKTIVNDTFEYNYTHLLPDYNPILIYVYSDDKHQYAFIHHNWSVEKDYDVYSKYEDYVVVLE